MNDCSIHTGLDFAGVERCLQWKLMIGLDRDHLGIDMASFIGLLFAYCRNSGWFHDGTGRSLADQSLKILPVLSLSTLWLSVESVSED